MSGSGTGPRRRRGLFSRWRRWHRRLNYESAERPRTPWSIRVDWALVVTGLLAILLVYSLQLSVDRTTRTRTLDFLILEDDEGTLSLQQTTDSVGAGEDMVHVILHTARAGWPISTATVTQDPLVSWAMRRITPPDDTPARQAMTSLPDHAPMAVLVMGTLAAHPDPEVQRFARGHQVDTDVFVFLVIAGVAWMLLWTISLPILGLLGIGEGVASQIGDRRRRKRKSRNKCQRCGYDLTGLEYSPACPECGELLT
ncbi:MAG: hypothetical protein MK116_03690 [Phycisphaerales bacterium]|nr:hypothetical protein [Phycisphaerales bacterium]